MFCIIPYIYGIIHNVYFVIPHYDVSAGFLIAVHTAVLGTVKKNRFPGREGCRLIFSVVFLLFCLHPGIRVERCVMLKFIGFRLNQGSMPNKDTGELIKWSKYELYFLENAKEGVVGSVPVISEAQTANLSIVGCKDLNELIGSEVIVQTDLTAKKDENGRVKNYINLLYKVG